MKQNHLFIVTRCAALLLVAIAAPAMAVGPDVIVGDLTLDSCAISPCHHSGPLGGIHAYSVGTTSCNRGDALLDWFAETDQHPVIGQGMYRLKDGRIEQLGIGWLKHGFCALQQGLCSPCIPAPGPGSCKTQLGVGCSDPYSAQLNGQQSGLGPRFEVNAATGVFPYPFSNPGGVTGNAIFKRIQVPETDLTTANSLYFMEGQYIHPDDAAFGNDNNNASYRRVTVSQVTFRLSLADTTVREKPAIHAWRDYGNGVGQPADTSVQIVNVDVPGDGRFIVAAKANDLGGGEWHYEYAIFNLNSDRAGGSVSVPVSPFVTVTNQGFRDVVYHSGEPYSNTDWSMTVTSSDAYWASPQTFGQNANSNALRFGTMYNFRFDADAPPQTGSIELGLFKTGAPASMSVGGLPIPSAPTCACLGDVTGDVLVDGADIGPFVSMVIGASPADVCADLASPSGSVDGADAGAFVNLLLGAAPSCGP